MATTPTDVKLDQLIINSVESHEVYKKMEEQGLINENEIYLVDGDDNQEKITANGILKGDGEGNITAAETVEAEVVDIPVGILKGTSSGLEAAVAGTDYASAETQSKVFATQDSLVKVTLAPADLVSYLNNLPRLLTNSIWINLTAGDVTKTVSLNNFYGSSRIRIYADDGANFTAGITCENSHIDISLEGITISGQGYADYKATILCQCFSKLSLINCSIVGDGTNTGIYLANQAGLVWVNGSITGCNIGINCFSGSTASIYSVTGSNNTTGIDPYSGGLVLLEGGTTQNLGSSTAYSGGNGLIIHTNYGLGVKHGGTGTKSVGGIAYSTLGFRGSKLASTDTNPDTNNTICWTYS